MVEYVGLDVSKEGEGGPWPKATVYQVALSATHVGD